MTPGSATAWPGSPAPNGADVPGRIRRILRAPSVFAWRYFTGKELDGVQRTDAGWFTPGHAELDQDEAPWPPETLGAEIRGDVRRFLVELRELRVRRWLGREWRDTERRVIAEHERGPDPDLRTSEPQ
jgi:hypothetical protein